MNCSLFKNLFLYDCCVASLGAARPVGCSKSSGRSSKADVEAYTLPFSMKGIQPRAVEIVQASNLCGVA